MSGEKILEQFVNCRNYSEVMCAGLEVEDFNLQVAEFTSPVKWHLAHTSWFFETFILLRYAPSYTAYHPQFQVLFNSYYNGVGEQFPRAQRAFLSRPGVTEVLAYRQHVTRQIVELINTPSRFDANEVLPLLVMGIQHEKQHQELIFTDLKNCLFQNPLYPAATMEGFDDSNIKPRQSIPGQNTTQQVAGGSYQVGTDVVGAELRNSEDFAFDNEGPAHTVWLESFTIASELVNNHAYLEFVQDGGYQRPELWLSDGWAAVQSQDWQHPLYWVQCDGEWQEYCLGMGLVPLSPQAPVRHLSAYEADAFASWSKQRLPTEFEWEVAARQALELVGCNSNSAGIDTNIDASGAASGWFKHVWQWTGSAYRPYPGYQCAAGAVGEYNGKFMGNQWVLRGSSSVTSDLHARTTYRNFFYLQDRWQYSGLRLVEI